MSYYGYSGCQEYGITMLVMIEAPAEIWMHAVSRSSHGLPRNFHGVMELS